MSNFKVILEFNYESTENISDWNIDVPFDYVTSTEQAKDCAIAELEANSPHEFSYNVEEGKQGITRGQFMSFFRDDEKLNTLSPDDRIEIFQTILLGSSDITADLLNGLISDYCVENLVVIDQKEQ